MFSKLGRGTKYINSTYIKLLEMKTTKSDVKKCWTQITIQTSCKINELEHIKLGNMQNKAEKKIFKCISLL